MINIIKKTNNVPCIKPDRQFSKGWGPVFLLAFFVPLVIMFLIYAAMEVWPFGNGAVLVLDLNGQYVYFFEELRNKIINGGSLLYSWSRAMGGEFLGIFAYYIASPFSFLVVLFPKDYITEALLTIILLKVGCCGFTMSLYLSKSHPTTKLNTVIFSTMYALCSYAIVQAHNTMWIDEMIFLPLLVLGVERLISKREYLLYIVSLSYSCMTNFYIGYMMCIFTFLYFFYYYFGHKDNYENNFYHESRHFIKSLLRIGLFSAVALCISCIIILPAYYSLTFGKTTFTNPSFDFVQKFDFLDMLAKLYPGSYDTVRPAGLPFIYCGTLTLILCPMYFISKGIHYKEKIATGLLMAAIVFSFNGSTIDIIWHGLQKPNWLNYRYSFMLVFLMVMCAYKAFCHIEQLEFNYILGMCGILGLLIIIIQKQDYEWLNDISCVWFSIACLAVYAIALRPISRSQMKTASRAILLIIVCLELFISGLLDEIAFDDDVTYSKRTSYRNFITRVQPAVDFIKQYDEENFGSEFYRMEKNTHRKTNDSMALGFYGLSNSTSTLNASVISLLAKMGYASKSHWAKYLGGTPVSDSLLGLKYLIFDEEYNDLLYENIKNYEDSELYCYYNPYALSLAYSVDNAISELSLEEIYTPFECLNAIVSAMYGEDVELFKSVQLTDITYENVDLSFTSNHKKYTAESSAKTAKLIFKFNAPSDAEIFCYFPSDYKREVAVKLNGEDYGTYFANETYRIVSLGTFEPNEEVFLSLTLNEENLYLRTGVDYFWYLDYELFDEVMSKLAMGNMNITHFEDTEIEGTVTGYSATSTVFTSIPYDEGWKIYVDGEETECKKVLDSLLAFDITEGTHDIRFVYFPDCIKYGIIISLCGLTAFAAVAVVEHNIKKKRHYAFVSSTYPDYME